MGEQAQTYFIERQRSIHRGLSAHRGKRQQFRSSMKRTPSAEAHRGGNGSPGMVRVDSGEARRNRENMVNGRRPSLDGPGMMYANNAHGNAHQSNGGGDNVPRTSPRMTSGPSRFLPTSAVHINRTFSSGNFDKGTALGQPLMSQSGGANGGAHHGSYGTLATLASDEPSTIRFQCVVWNIGRLDVVAASVPMTFRITLFWNDVEPAEPDDPKDDLSTFSAGSMNVWKMHNRDKAFPAPMMSDQVSAGQKAVEVPPLSILNCSSFETIGSPEVEMLCEHSRLMRWSCMYRANMLQDDLRVDSFPHDEHDVCIKLAVLSHRGRGRQWDRNVWKLALATKEDSMGSTRVPEGLLVDHARLPGFAYNKSRGLDFRIVPLEHGAFDQEESREECLRISLRVLRESGYYDKNVVPLVALMNIVAVSVLTFRDTEFFYRALITNNIAFVQMSIRMTADSHLPSVGYQIRLQRILNEFFFVLLCLVLEAMTVYVLSEYGGVSLRATRAMDVATGVLAVSHNFFTVGRYYQSMRRAQRRLRSGGDDEGAAKDASDAV